MTDKPEDEQPQYEAKAEIHSGTNDHLMLYIDGRLLATYIPASTRRGVAKIEMTADKAHLHEEAVNIFAAYLAGKFGKSRKFTVLRGGKDNEVK